MTAEISGLPIGGRFREELSRPREQWISQFGKEPPTSDYKVYDDPIPVRIKGSLFFDIQHRPFERNSPGTGDLKPHRVWEIHPVTAIEFLE